MTHLRSFRVQGLRNAKLLGTNNAESPRRYVQHP